ncbi:IS66 family insertion sequence element accessory protein TnpB [Paraburkholderia sp. JHI869]
MIRIDAIWLATEPLDMRAGTNTILARVVKVFGAARPHHAYLFANRHSTRMKVLVYNGFGIWLAARRLNKGRFVWTNGEQTIATALNPEQLRAMVTGLPWQTLVSPCTSTAARRVRRRAWWWRLGVSARARRTGSNVRSSRRPFNGAIDEFRIYRGARRVGRPPARNRL